DRTTPPSLPIPNSSPLRSFLLRSYPSRISFSSMFYIPIDPADAVSVEELDGESTGTERSPGTVAAMACAYVLIMLVIFLVHTRRSRAVKQQSVDYLTIEKREEEEGKDKDDNKGLMMQGPIGLMNVV
ncbi:hypothetical protein PFISCL1PPCAC_13869, partial [Pristionchus fissidentatus]